MSKNDEQLETVLRQALELSPSQQVVLLERVAGALRTHFAEPGDTHENRTPAWTEEEVAELLRVEPLTPQEMAARGLFGTWRDQGITDGAEWVNEQKRKRKARR